MTPDGEVAKALVDAGYKVAELPSWFSASAHAGAKGADADVRVVDAGVKVSTLMSKVSKMLMLMLKMLRKRCTHHVHPYL